MSFGISPNIINCYFLLSKKTIDSNIYGNISGPFSKNTLISDGITHIDNTNSIIYNRTDLNAKKTDFVVGIPEKNGNNISKKQIYAYMALYNIPTLMSIRPYISHGSRDTGEGSYIDNSNCITPKERKIAALKGFNLGNVTRLSQTDINSLYHNNNFHSKICFHKL